MNADTINDLEHARAALRAEQDARANLRVEADRYKRERDEVRNDLVKALQTLEANSTTPPVLFLCDQPSMCACCGRMRGDGRKDRNWKYIPADVNGERRFAVRVAFCPKCFAHLEGRAAKHVAKEPHELPGELEEDPRG